MKKYALYFEIYGKKMKATVLAATEKEAKEAIKNKIKFHKVEEQEASLDDALNAMSEFLNTDK